jgi:hypothetical protein
VGARRVPVVDGVAEGEDVADGVVGTRSTAGEVRWAGCHEPNEPASPKDLTRPAAVRSQYPSPVGVRAIVTTGAARSSAIAVPCRDASP